MAAIRPDSSPRSTVPWNRHHRAIRITVTGKTRRVIGPIRTETASPTAATPMAIRGAMNKSDEWALAGGAALLVWLLFRRESSAGPLLRPRARALSIHPATPGHNYRGPG